MAKPLRALGDCLQPLLTGTRRASFELAGDRAQHQIRAAVGLTFHGEHPGMSWQAAGFEAILTCGLVLMVLNVANGPKLNGPYVPLAVGGYVIAWATIGGPYDGAAMNPARALGPDAAIGNLSTWWVYLIGPAVVAVGVAYVLRGPAKAQEALAAMGTPLQGIKAQDRRSRP